jgi:hypothetical protein
MLGFEPSQVLGERSAALQAGVAEGGICSTACMLSAESCHRVASSPAALVACQPRMAGQATDYVVRPRWQCAVASCSTWQV